jgi:hypothetical protein
MLDRYKALYAMPPPQPYWEVPVSAVETMDNPSPTYSESSRTPATSVISISRLARRLPDQPEAQNAELLQHEGKCTAPSYDWMDEQCHNLFVKLKRPVPAGEETDRLVIVTRIQDSYFISS